MAALGAVLAGATLAPVADAPPTGRRAPAVEVDAAGARRAALVAAGARALAADGLAELEDMDEGVAPRLHDTKRTVCIRPGYSSVSIAS